MYIHSFRYSLPLSRTEFVSLKVKRMQRPGTEAIRTQIEPLKLKREITKFTNSQNTKRTYGQPIIFCKTCCKMLNLHYHKSGNISVYEANAKCISRHHEEVSQCSDEAQQSFITKVNAGATMDVLILGSCRYTMIL